MDKIDWKRKLSSRKFWGMIVNLVTNILVVINVPDNEIAQIVALIMAGAGVIAYIFAEGWIDASNNIEIIEVEKAE